jgi:putative ABC transport system substrate-binding protein
MNKKMVVIGCALIVGLLGFEAFMAFNKPKPKKSNPLIGIIIPLTHPAMDKIVTGFCTELDKLLSKQCDYVVRDAQGDQNVQQPAIIDEMKRKNVDMIVPIGTLCTQMTLQKASEIPVVALASIPSSIVSERNLATGVNDEIACLHALKLIEGIIPKISKIAIIASQSEKTMPQIQAFRSEALNKGIAVQTIYVQTPSDIFLATHSIDNDAQAIHILKDHLVVNSIATLNQIAQDKKIPVIASDEGSVERGAACAIGVEESEIGKAGAQLAFNVLSGKLPGDLGIKTLDKLTIFINKKSCKRQGAAVGNIVAYAHKNNLTIAETSPT